MKFKSYIGKQVMCGQKIICFVKDVYETEDEKEIASLSCALDVEQLKQRGKKAQDSKDDSQDEKPDDQPEGESDDSAP